MNDSQVQVSTGAQYFYLASSTRFMLRYIFTMDTPVSRDNLQKAVDTAMKRYPYFRVRAVLIDNTYKLEKNDLPFIVYEGDEFISLGDKRINGHLVSFACNGNDLYIDYFHGLTDGRGMMPLLRSVFYYYSIYHYGETPDSTNVNLADDPVDPAETVDPISIPVPEVQPFDLTIPTTAYRLPENSLPEEAPTLLRSITIPQKEFMKHVRSVEGSPAAVAALFLCRAIDAIHPEHEEPLICGMAVEFRNDLGCPKTYRNCNSSISLEYHKEMREYDLERQVTTFRGQIMLQTSAEHLLPAFARKQMDYVEMEKLPTMRDKAMACLKDVLRYPATTNCSYAGKANLGEIEKHIKVRHIYTKFGGRGIVLEISAIGEKFGIDFICDVDSDLYFNEFVRQIADAGIDVQIGEPISFDISPRCF